MMLRNDRPNVAAAAAAVDNDMQILLEVNGSLMRALGCRDERCRAIKA